MTYIKTVSEAAATGEVAELYRRLAYRDGSVDEAFKALSLSPELLAADAALYDTLMYHNSPLSRAERELLAFTVSGLNGCDRCLRHHSSRHRALEVSENGDRSEPDPAARPRNEREQALLAFAEKLTLRPHTIREVDIHRLRQAGLVDRAILDACNVIAYFNYANRVTLGLGIDAEPGGTEERGRPVP